MVAGECDASLSVGATLLKKAVPNIINRNI